MAHTATVQVNSRAVKRLKQGHLWIYASDVLRMDQATGGDVVLVVDEGGRTYGYAFFSATSQITLRWCAPPGLPPDLEFWRTRLCDAEAYRRTVVRDSDAYRLIFSEGDLIPSLLIDRYGEHFVIQTLAQGTDRLKDVWVQLLAELYAPASISERNDSAVRQYEALPQQRGVLYGTLPDEIAIRMNGVEIGVEILGGQKTGAFLDQRENYAAAARYAFGRTLDAFTFAGGFALHLAPRVTAVTAVDISEEACVLARKNAERNGINNMEVVRANVFDYMHALDRNGATFDTIVLDPPAFAKSKTALENAYRGYKEINLRALRMLSRGGILVTCSCSYHMNEPLFLQMLGEAAADAGRPVRVIEHRLQARDHPVLLGVPESGYLKCIIAQALE